MIDNGVYKRPVPSKTTKNTALNSKNTTTRTSLNLKDMKESKSVKKIKSGPPTDRRSEKDEEDKIKNDEKTTCYVTEENEETKEKEIVEIKKEKVIIKIPINELFASTFIQILNYLNLKDKINCLGINKVSRKEVINTMITKYKGLSLKNDKDFNVFKDVSF